MSEDQQQDRQSIDDMIGSLTGYEEQKIEDQWGREVLRLLAQSPTRAGRALVFIDKIRTGMDEGAAKVAVMEMRLDVVDDYFTDEDPADSLDPDATPASEPGKGAKRTTKRP